MCRTIGYTPSQRASRLRRRTRGLFRNASFGAFGQQQETLPYMAALRSLVKTFVQVAHAAEIKYVWEKALFHALELQRLDAIAPLDVRCLTSFILLNLYTVMMMRLSTHGFFLEKQIFSFLDGNVSKVEPSFADWRKSETETPSIVVCFWLQNSVG